MSGSENQSFPDLFPSLCGGDGTILLEDGLQRRDLAGENLLVFFIFADDSVALAGITESDRRNFGFESPGSPSLAGLVVRCQSVVVLILTSDVMLSSRLLGAENSQRIS